MTQVVSNQIYCVRKLGIKFCMLNSGVGASICVGIVSVCGHTASVYLEADSNFCPLVFQGS